MVTLLFGLGGVAIIIAIGCWAILYKQKKNDEIVIERQKPPKIKKVESIKKRIGSLFVKRSNNLDKPVLSKSKIRPTPQNLITKKASKEIQLPASLSNRVREEVAEQKMVEKQKKIEQKAKVKEIKNKAKELKKERDKKQSEAVKKVRELLDERKKRIKELKKVKPISEIEIPVVEIKTKRPVPVFVPVKVPVVPSPSDAKKKDSYIELWQTLVGWRYRIKKHGIKGAAVSELYPSKVAIMKIIEPLAKDLGIEIKEPKQIKK